MTKALLVAVALVLSGCGPGEFGAGAKMANTVLVGAACGMAAANDVPCTPRAVVDSLAKDAASQETKVKALAPAAAAVDPSQTQLLLDQMAANTESNRKLTGALLTLIEKGTVTPTPSASSAPAAAPPAPASTSSSAPAPASP